VIAAGNMNPTQTEAVAPVNWKISQMLGMEFAPMKILPTRAIVIDANLKLSTTKGLLEEENMRPSMLTLNA
jgi:hypothetical protein